MSSASGESDGRRPNDDVSCNIYPGEIELAIDALNGVAESAVIGVPHPDLGEGVVAVVARVPGREAVTDTLAAQLAAFERPRHIVIVDEPPRDVMGKVQKAELRTLYRGIFAAGPG